jgi:hemolysin activation/secretion protein
MPRPVRTALFAAVLACCAGAPSVAFTQQPTPEVAAPRFNIDRFEFAGATLIPPQALERLTAPFTGAVKDFGDVQRALEVVEEAYRARGYGIVRVLLPEQDITQGVVRFQVLEPRVGRVVIEGNNFFDADNIRNSLPAVQEGVTPNSAAMSRNLQILAEHPTRQTSLALRPGASEDQVDVAVRITDEKPLRYFFTLDNTGTGETGYFRSGFGFQHSNLFNKDHVLTAQYITSPTQLSDVTILGLGYRIPFYGLNSSLDLVAGYSNVDSGTVGGLFNVAGSGSIGAVRWNYYLPRWGQLEQKIAAGLDYRAFQNDVTQVGTNVNSVPDITLHPLSLTYSGLRRFADAELSFYGAASANIPGGNDGDQEAFSQVGQRPGANANYAIFRAGANYAKSLTGEWQVRATVNGQYTTDSLVSGEQFGVGGPDSVRGYPVREIAGDRGYQGQLELYTPDLGPRVGLSDAYRMRFLAFYDFGYVRDNDPPRNAQQPQDFIYSVGLGMRMSYRKVVSFRLDGAQIMQPTLNRQTDSFRVTGALAVVF